MFDIKRLKDVVKIEKNSILKNEIKKVVEKWNKEVNRTSIISICKEQFIPFFIAIAAISITMVSTVGGPTSLVQSKKYSITTNKAEEYFYGGEYEKAIQEYIDIELKDPSSLKWDEKIAEIYSVKGDMENSKKYLQKVKAASSKDIELLNAVIFTEFVNKEYGEALKDGEEALKIESQNKNLIKTMFTVYMANNQMEKAKKLIATYPVDNKSSYDTAEYARMLMIAGDLENGFKELRNAWDINKDEFKIYDVLAQIALYNKNTLLESVTNLSTKNPNDIAYKMWLAKIYSLSEDTADQAGKILDSIGSGDLGKIEHKLIRAAILQNTKKVDKADEIIQEVIKKNENDYSILHTAGWYYLNKGDVDSALEYCKKSILKNKNYPDNYGFLMPEILKAKEKSIVGEPFFRTAMEKEPYNYNIMLTIANYYWNTTKNSEKALEYFKFAEIVKPTDAEIKYNMALIHLANNRQDDAISLLKECIKLSDIVPKYHRTLGTIYMVKGITKDGYKEIQYAFQSDKEDILTLNNAGCYYTSVEQNLERGLLNFQKAFEGITPYTDKYTRDTITDNYNKAKKLLSDFRNGNDNQVLAIPDFILFY